MVQTINGADCKVLFRCGSVAASPRAKLTSSNCRNQELALKIPLTSQRVQSSRPAKAQLVAAMDKLVKGSTDCPHTSMCYLPQAIIGSARLFLSPGNPASKLSLLSIRLCTKTNTQKSQGAVDWGSLRSAYSTVSFTSRFEPWRDPRIKQT